MIEIKNLTKNFSDFQAVKNVSFNVNDGESFALLGPNGAGKTTIIRMLTTLSLPTSGNVKINGFDLVKEAQEIKKFIGIVHQRMNLDNFLTAEENLILHARLHKIDKSSAKKRIKKLLDFVELTDRKDTLIKNYSGGMKRRLMIARAILHKPKILFLDEPTVGLDPQVRRKIWNVLHQMHQQGLSIVLTTHYIEEAEQLCEKVAIMSKGELVTLDSPQNLCAGYGKYVVEDLENQKFFLNYADAHEYTENISGKHYIRKITLEDVFVEITGKKAAKL